MNCNTFVFVKLPYFDIKLNYKKKRLFCLLITGLKNLTCLKNKSALSEKIVIIKENIPKLQKIITKAKFNKKTYDNFVPNFYLS